MEKSKSVFLSPKEQQHEEFEGFLFVPDEDVNVISYDITPTKSPRGSPFQNSIIPAVMSALTTIACSEKLLVTNIAKTVLTGAASRLTGSSIGGVPGMAMGALIAGGIYAFRTLRNRSANDVLRSLTPSQQKQLIARLRNGSRQFGVHDLAFEILNRSDVKDFALEILNDFLQEKCGVKIMRVL